MLPALTSGAQSAAAARRLYDDNFVASHHGRIAFVHDDGHSIVQLILPAIQGE